MDSPGNDLESIAGQVASGCNMVAFTTGNGSITNFPFVPTVKVHKLLAFAHQGGQYNTAHITHPLPVWCLRFLSHAHTHNTPSRC